VVAWGANYSHQTNLPPGLTNAVALAGGFEHTVAIADDFPPKALGSTNTGFPNVDLAVQLRASDTNGDLVNFQIGSLPAAGALYQYTADSRGPAITSVGQTILDSAGRVIFAPAPNGLGNPYDTFSYIANDGLLDSSVANVRINITLPPAPQFLSGGALWTTGTGFQLKFSGPSNAAYRIWGSSNLIDWIPLGSATPAGNGLFQFQDPASFNLPRRFYKAGAP